MARLVAIGGEVDGQTFAIEDGLTIGRAAHNAVVLARTRGASRDHAKVWRLGVRDYALADLGSTNGTLVNDAEVERATLREGDMIQVGDATFRFELDEAERLREPSRPAVSAPVERHAPAAPGQPPQIQVRERLLQYHKKRAGGSPLNWDLGQTTGLQRWGLVLLAVAMCAGLFVLVQNLV